MIDRILSHIISLLIVTAVLWGAISFVSWDPRWLFDIGTWVPELRFMLMMGYAIVNVVVALAVWS